MKDPRASRRKPGNPAARLLIVYWAIDQLKLDLRNARRHSEKQIRQIANSIKAFGFNVPILIDRDGNVIAGHGRLLACRQLGITEVPTLCLDHLNAHIAQIESRRNGVIVCA
jgi:ParB-like chromosome segregation protein Spo0J